MTAFVTSLAVRALVTLPVYIAVLLILRTSAVTKLGVRNVKNALLCLMLPLVIVVPSLKLPHTAALDVLAPVVSAAGNVGSFTGGIGEATVGQEMVGAVLTVIWAVGAVCMIAVRIFGMLKVRGSVKRAMTRSEQRGRVSVVYCTGNVSPMAYGILRPTIVLFDTDSGMNELFYRHELAHIKRGDLAIRAGMTLLCAVYWFDPCVAMLERALYEVSEPVCDADALDGSDIEARRSYCRALVSYSRKNVRPTLNTSFSANANKMKVRIEAVMTNNAKLPNKKRRIVIISIAAALVLVCLLMTSMVYSTKTVTLGDVTVEIPGYWSVKKVSEDKSEFYSAGALAGELVKADDDAEYAAYIEGRLQQDGTRFLILAPPKDMDVLYNRGKLDRTLEGNVTITDGFYYGYSMQATGCDSSYFLYLKAANSIGIPINPQSQADKIAQTLVVNK